MDLLISSIHPFLLLWEDDHVGGGLLMSATLYITEYKSTGAGDGSQSIDFLGPRFVGQFLRNVLLWNSAKRNDT